MSTNPSTKPLATFSLWSRGHYVGCFIIVVAMMALLVGANSHWHFGSGELILVFGSSSFIGSLFAGMTSTYLSVNVFPAGLRAFQGPVIPWCQITTVRLIWFVPAFRVIEVRDSNESGSFIWIPLRLVELDQLAELVRRHAGDTHPLALMFARIQAGDIPKAQGRYGAAFIVLWFTGILVAVAFGLRDEATEGYAELRPNQKATTTYRFDIPAGWYANHSRSKQGYKNVLLYDPGWKPRIGVELSGSRPIDQRAGAVVARLRTGIGDVELRREARQEFPWSWLMPKSEEGGVIWTANGEECSLQWSTTAAWERELRPIVDQGLRSLRKVPED